MVRIGLLGTLQVHDDAGNPVRIGGHRVRSLLVLLALDPGRVVPAASLIDRLWPDSPPADAGNALQTLVSRLRVALRGTGVIESHPVGYRLVVDPAAVDAGQFEELARRGRASGDARLLREALAIWRGPALADVADEEFAQGPAARLEELRLAALLDRIEADLAAGEADGLVGELRSLVSAHPLAERSRVLLMRALQAAGRQADALAVYTQARELLADQLGVDPSPELERAYLAVLRQENHRSTERGVPSPQVRPSPVRRPVASFVGRETDVRGVREQLGKHRLVTLTGPGGIGKTRLAAEVAESLDGASVHVIELARVSAGGDVPFAVLDAVSERSMAIRPPEAAAGTDPLDRLGAALADREAVIILDNCEHLVDAAAVTADRVLADCPRVTILATSREPLRITGEVLWPVTPLPGDAAVTLFTDRARAVVPGFEVEADNADAVRRICRALDGMPLAIELAAVWLRVLSPGQLAERIGDRFALLTSGSRLAMPRHQTLRAVVDWSWESLSKPERTLARRLSVFPGGVTLETAEGVCADESLPARDVLPALSGLVGKSILMAGAGTRYRMLETIRAYGQERLAEAGEEDQVQSAFIGYYLSLAERADPMLRTAEQTRWLRELDAELDNVHAAVRLTITRRDGDSALRFVRALGWYWMIRVHGEAESLAREVLRMPADDSVPLVAEGRVICAMIAAGQSWDVEGVREEFVAAVRVLNERFPDPAPLHPVAAFGEPMLALSDMDPDRGIAIMEGYSAAPDSWEQAALALMRSQFCAMAGRQVEAEELLFGATERFRSLGDMYLLCAALAMVADIKAIRGDRAGAIAALREAARASGHLGIAAIDRGYFEAKLGALQIRIGDLDAAREQLKRADALRGKNSDDGLWLDLIHAELAWVAGDNAEATRQCEAILVELAAKKSMWWEPFRGTVQARAAIVALSAGDREQARERLASALPTTGQWLERPPLATVIDAVAVFVVGDDPALAATLLGAGDAIRGGFDESSLDSPAARDAARRALGEDAYAAAYQRGRDLSQEEAVALASSVTNAPRDADDSGAAPVGHDGERGEYHDDAHRPQQ